MDHLRVAVAVLTDAEGRVLVAHRAAARHQGGRLELPGGKIEPGETPEAGLARELAEELGVHPTRSAPLIRVRHDYGDRRVELDTFRVTAWEGRPHGREGQAIEWQPVDALDPARFPAANRPILAALQWPATGLVTPELPDDDRVSERLHDGVLRAVEAGVRLVQLREPAWSEERLLAAAERLAGLSNRGVRLLVNAPLDVADALPPGVGLHLSARRAAAVDRRPFDRSRYFSASAHDLAEVRQAERIGVDCAFVGPVHATASHRSARALGWEGVRALATRTTTPLYGLGGLGPTDLRRARGVGLIGIAGIRGFWTPSDAN